MTETNQTTERPRSGYARLKSRHRHLIEMHERLQADHGELERAFAELLELHNNLLADLKRPRPAPQPAPARFGQALMGYRYG
jgi:hypothetical protein